MKYDSSVISVFNGQMHKSKLVRLTEQFHEKQQGSKAQKNQELLQSVSWHATLDHISNKAQSGKDFKKENDPVKWWGLSPGVWPDFLLMEKKGS